MRIAVAGMGYVGLSIAALLSRRHTVTIRDILLEKVAKLQRKEAPFADLAFAGMVDERIARPARHARLRRSLSRACRVRHHRHAHRLQTPTPLGFDTASVGKA